MVNVATTAINANGRGLKMRDQVQARLPVDARIAVNYSFNEDLSIRYILRIDPR